MKSVVALSILFAIVNALPATQSRQDQVDSLGYNAAADAKVSVAVLLQEGKDQGACADLAAASIQEVTNAVHSSQKILDALDTGADCPKTGQDGVDQAQTALDNANKAKADAEQAAQSALATPVKFAPVVFSMLEEGECGSFFSDPAYIAAKKAEQDAKTDAEKAAGAVSGAEAALAAAQKAQQEAVAKCQMAVRCAYDKAFAAATENNDANDKAYAKGKHMECVLQGTPPADCQVGEVPQVEPVQLANGVPGECEQQEKKPQQEEKPQQEDAAPACVCAVQEEIPAFMQIETSEGTDWIEKYTINSPQDGGSLIPHPGGTIKMALRCGKFCGEAEHTWTTTFGDANLYNIQKVNDFNNVGADVSILWDLLPKVAHSASETAYVKSFLGKGGRFFVMGENNGCCGSNNAIVTSSVAALGGAVKIRNKDGGQGTLTQKNINKLQVTSGLTEVVTAAWCSLKVDKSVSEVIATNNAGDIFMADQQLEKGRITVWADINPLDSSRNSNGQNRKFWKNLVHQGVNFVKAVENGQNPNANGPCQC